MTCTKRAGHDTGNAAIELVFLAVVLVLLIGMVIAFGRVSLAQSAIAAAARDAARQASISQSPTGAQAAGKDSALAALRGDHLDCVSQPVVDVNTSQFSKPLGQEAEVSATVSCAIRIFGLGLPGVLAARTIRATFSSPLNPFEARAP